MKRIQPLHFPPLRHPRWQLLVAAFSLFGVVAAFGIAPDTVPDQVPTQTLVQDLKLPEPASTDVADADSFDFWMEERIQRGDTIASLLDRLGVGVKDKARVIALSHQTPALHRLTPGRTVLARVTASGQLLLLRYLTSDERLLTLSRAQGAFVAEETAIQPDVRHVMRAGAIHTAFFAATDAAGIPYSIASQMVKIFSGEIDFHRDLRRGDRFAVIYEALYHDGKLIKTGRLLAAEFVNQGKVHRAIYFQDSQGREGYFTPQGRSMKPAFLKSPLPFTRITSGFSKTRYHPILKEWRAHRGIDYAAPAGTPVWAVADGTVAFAGRKGGYGNIVVLKHQKPYSTAYAHLSRFARGIRPGKRVKQGEVIGYVGATGLATGPHLHYEFRVAGVPKNPMALKLPASFALDSRDRARFLAQSRPLLARLELLQGSNLASLD